MLSYRHDFCRQKAIREIKRVLKDDGKFYFLDHGKSNNKFVQILQDKIGINIRLNDIIENMNESNAPKELLDFFKKLDELNT